MQEVTGSIPVTSTNPESLQQKSPSSRGLGHRPFTAVTGVRIPVGTPMKIKRKNGRISLPDSVGAKLVPNRCSGKTLGNASRFLTQQGPKKYRSEEHTSELQS